MFETLEMAPPDAILGLNETFRNDSNPDKINLSVGVYKNQDGITPILDCVKAAEQKLLAEEKLQECLTREERVFNELQKLNHDIGSFLINHDGTFNNVPEELKQKDKINYKK